MGLFHKNENEVHFAGGSKNIIESIQRSNNTKTLIYLDPRQDFNTNSVITVAPNEQVIFIKNGSFYGVLPSGRHEIKTENYPVLSRIRNMLSGGISTFTCQVYHVSTNEQLVNWGTTMPIQVKDYFLGNGVIGVRTEVRGAAAFRVRFNINENDESCKQTFMRLMGDMRSYTVIDLERMFEAEISQKVRTTVGKMLGERSRITSISAIDEELEDFAESLKPHFDELFAPYGLEIVNFSFYNLTIDETEERKKYMDRLIAAAHAGSYDKAIQQELLKDVAVNQGAGGVANLGVGLGMGMTMGNAFAQMSTNIFDNSQKQSNNSIINKNVAQQSTSNKPDPYESLSKMKQLLDAGLIQQSVYDAKVAEILSRL